MRLAFPPRMTSKQHPSRQQRRRWNALRLRILERDGYACVHCGARGRMEVDHIIPVDAGGAAWDPANLQTLERTCHLAKTALERGTTPGQRTRARWDGVIRRLPPYRYEEGAPVNDCDHGFCRKCTLNARCCKCGHPLPF